MAVTENLCEEKGRFFFLVQMQKTDINLPHIRQQHYTEGKKNDPERMKNCEILLSSAQKEKMQNELKNGKMLQFLQKMALKLQNSYIVSSYNKLAISAMIPKWQKS